jgi:hypothetical protein
MEHCSGGSWLIDFQLGDLGILERDKPPRIMKAQSKAVPGRRSGGVFRVPGTLGNAPERLKTQRESPSASRRRQLANKALLRSHSGGSVGEVVWASLSRALRRSLRPDEAAAVEPILLHFLRPVNL